MFQAAEKEEKELSEAASMRDSSTPSAVEPLYVASPNDYFEKEANTVAQLATETQFGIKDFSAFFTHNNPSPLKVISESTSSTLNQMIGYGKPLDHSTKSEMSGYFDKNLDHVRIHDDSSSHRLNQDLDAQAFTYKSDIFLRNNGYQPQNPFGHYLLVHELAHSFQQSTKAAPKGVVQRLPYSYPGNLFPSFTFYKKTPFELEQERLNYLSQHAYSLIDLQYFQLIEAFKYNYLHALTYLLLNPTLYRKNRDVKGKIAVMLLVKMDYKQRMTVFSEPTLANELVKSVEKEKLQYLVRSTLQSGPEKSIDWATFGLKMAAVLITAGLVTYATGGLLAPLMGKLIAGAGITSASGTALATLGGHVAIGTASGLTGGFAAEMLGQKLFHPDKDIDMNRVLASTAGSGVSGGLLGLVPGFRMGRSVYHGVKNLKPGVAVTPEMLTATMRAQTFLLGNAPRGEFVKMFGAGSAGGSIDYYVTQKILGKDVDPATLALIAGGGGLLSSAVGGLGLYLKEAHLGAKLNVGSKQFIDAPIPKLTEDLVKKLKQFSQKPSLVLGEEIQNDLHYLSTVTKLMSEDNLQLARYASTKASKSLAAHDMKLNPENDFQELFKLAKAIPESNLDLPQEALNRALNSFDAYKKQPSSQLQNEAKKALEDLYTAVGTIKGVDVKLAEGKYNAALRNLSLFSQAQDVKPNLNKLSEITNELFGGDKQFYRELLLDAVNGPKAHRSVAEYSPYFNQNVPNVRINYFLELLKTQSELVQKTMTALKGGTTAQTLKIGRTDLGESLTIASQHFNKAGLHPDVADASAIYQIVNNRIYFDFNRQIGPHEDKFLGLIQKRLDDYLDVKGWHTFVGGHSLYDLSFQHPDITSKILQKIFRNFGDLKNFNTKIKLEDEDVLFKQLRAILDKDENVIAKQFEDLLQINGQPMDPTQIKVITDQLRQVLTPEKIVLLFRSYGFNRRIKMDVSRQKSLLNQKEDQMVKSVLYEHIPEAKDWHLYRNGLLESTKFSNAQDKDLLTKFLNKVDEYLISGDISKLPDIKKVPVALNKGDLASLEATLGDLIRIRNNLNMEDKLGVFRKHMSDSETPDRLADWYRSRDALLRSENLSDREAKDHLVQFFQKMDEFIISGDLKRGPGKELVAVFKQYASQDFQKLRLPLIKKRRALHSNDNINKELSKLSNPLEDTIKGIKEDISKKMQNIKPDLNILKAEREQVNKAIQQLEYHFLYEHANYKPRPFHAEILGGNRALTGGLNALGRPLSSVNPNDLKRLLVDVKYLKEADRGGSMTFCNRCVDVLKGVLLTKPLQRLTRQKLLRKGQLQPTAKEMNLKK